jgi:hypothetical protein
MEDKAKDKGCEGNKKKNWVVPKQLLRVSKLPTCIQAKRR